MIDYLIGEQRCVVILLKRPGTGSQRSLLKALGLVDEEISVRLLALSIVLTKWFPAMFI